jgi:hypothetical protein
LVLKKLIDVILLIVACNIHKSDITGKWSDAILEINQVKNKVGEKGELGVVLTLLDHDEVFIVNLVLSVILEDFSKSDLITVAEIVHVLEELLLLTIRLVVVAVLS